jgi:hypothetical protein
MAEMRFFTTSIWHDKYVVELNPDQLCLYLYLHLNSEISYYGVLEYNLCRIADESNFDKEFVKETINKFKKDGKIVLKQHKIFVKGFLKRTTSPTAKAINTKTTKALKGNKYKLHLDILEAVLEEIAEIEKEKKARTESGGDDITEGDEDELEDEENLSLTQRICSQYEYYFGESLDSSDSEITEILHKTKMKINRYSKAWHIKKNGLVELLMESLVDWLEWTKKENLTIGPGHLCSDEIWEKIVSSYINKNPKKVSQYRVDGY